MKHTSLSLLVILAICACQRPEEGGNGSIIDRPIEVVDHNLDFTLEVSRGYLEVDLTVADPSAGFTLGYKIDSDSSLEIADTDGNIIRSGSALTLQNTSSVLLYSLPILSDGPHTVDVTIASGENSLTRSLTFLGEYVDHDFKFEISPIQSVFSNEQGQTELTIHSRNKGSSYLVSYLIDGKSDLLLYDEYEDPLTNPFTLSSSEDTITSELHLPTLPYGEHQLTITVSLEGDSQSKTVPIEVLMVRATGFRAEFKEMGINVPPEKLVENEQYDLYIELLPTYCDESVTYVTSSLGTVTTFNEGVCRVKTLNKGDMSLGVYTTTGQRFDFVERVYWQPEVTISYVHSDDRAEGLFISGKFDSEHSITMTYVLSANSYCTLDGRRFNFSSSETLPISSSYTLPWLEDVVISSGDDSGEYHYDGAINLSLLEKFVTSIKYQNYSFKFLNGSLKLSFSSTDPYALEPQKLYDDSYRTLLNGGYQGITNWSFE